MTEPSHRFRGSLLRRRWTRSQPIDVVEVVGERLQFHPWLRHDYTLNRNDVAKVIVDKTRVMPFWWTTDFRFILRAGEEALRFFRPLRPKRFVGMLHEGGWPVDSAS